MSVMLKTPAQRLNEVLLQCCIYAEECNRLRALDKRCQEFARKRDKEGEQ